jgi:hypothetical protein
VKKLKHPGSEGGVEVGIAALAVQMAHGGTFYLTERAIQEGEKGRV